MDWPFQKITRSAFRPIQCFSHMPQKYKNINIYIQTHANTNTHKHLTHIRTHTHRQTQRQTHKQTDRYIRERTITILP